MPRLCLLPAPEKRRVLPASLDWQIVATNITGIMLTIAFDLDGTLIDTAPDLISTLNLVLAGESLPPLDYDDARGMIGGGVLKMIERALEAGRP
jgi:hypothetical protein